MKRLAFVFTQPPHTTSAGREGLDALLAASSLCDDICVFFVGDGVFQLLAQQQPQSILCRDYISTFKVMSLYDIKQVYLCTESLQERGLNDDVEWIIAVNSIPAQEIQARLARCDKVLTF